MHAVWPERPSHSGFGGSMFSNRELVADLYRHVMAFGTLALLPLLYLLVVERVEVRELGVGTRGSGRMFLLVSIWPAITLH